ncbi:MAG: hypothetical protein NVS1B14_03620 [Vulcanimicrobiaceae bacterium]
MPQAPRGNITTRITVLWLVLFAAGLAAFALLASRTIVATSQEALDASLETQAIAAAAAIDGATGRIENDVPKVEIGGFALVVYREGNVQQIVGTRPASRAVALGAKVPLRSAQIVMTNPQYRVDVQPSENAKYRVGAFAWEGPVLAEAVRLRRIFLSVGLPLLLFATFAGWLLARRLLAPIAQFSQTAGAPASLV